MNKFLFCFSFLTSIFLFCACNDNNTQTEKIKTAKTTVVKAYNKNPNIKMPGKVMAASEADVSFKVAGTIQKIYVQVGDFVKKGQIIALMDSSDYKIQFDAAKAEYHQIKTQCERVMAAYKEGAGTASDNDKALYGLQQITAKYQHAKDQLNYCKLLAPFDGYVQKKMFQERENVSAGLPIISLIGSSAPEIEIHLPAIEYMQRKNFKNFYCSFDIFPNKTFNLKPKSISPKANSNQLYPMRLQFEQEGSQDLPTPGMNTMVEIQIADNQSNELIVPNSAITEEVGNNEKPCVFKVLDNNTVKKTQIAVIQLLSNGDCIISSTELKEGDKVVSAGIRSIKDGQSIKIIDNQSSTNVGGLL